MHIAAGTLVVAVAIAILVVMLARFAFDRLEK
jgi:hypothetical protein